MKRLIKYIVLVGGVLFFAAAILGMLFWCGVIQLNGRAARQFPVHGVDVSEYQGEIDWEVLAAQDISFAFIKATEGSGYVDPQFSDNWKNAAETELRIGAYHFFSFDSSGETQAALFTQTVEPVENMLPPVVDVEYYGDYRETPPDRETVKQELSTMLNALEEVYGMKPILYVAGGTFWLTEAFPEYAYWERSVYSGPPGGDAERTWTFWQYSNRLRLKGYDGVERYIDGNVFVGSEEEFAVYGT
ncbi:MAG: GH25 family lysozyme [Ruminococcus sp.]